MKPSTFGALAAGAVIGLVGSAAFVRDAGAADEEKACYRTRCGDSVAGYEGKCGGTRVEEIRDEVACETAGGVWTTADDAKQYEDDH
jgi:uncharacterized low-complexity protein